ncbi:hypothetical protein ABZ957_15570 [Streptomyces sp. NPDC046316]|uniref:hypothetical protein n=1 Tax=Streptomyces sp. NPDC046316 TaxID=3154494 RepID=UPI0033FBE63B
MRHDPFPDDLVAAQRSWVQAYEALAQPGAPRTTVLRRRLVQLSADVYFHPYWAHPRPAAGRTDLLDLVRGDARKRVGAA